MIRTVHLPAMRLFRCFWVIFVTCDFPRSAIKVWGGGGGVGCGEWPLVKLYSHHYNQIDI